MFRDNRKAQCRRARRMLGDLVDGRLGLNEKADIERHLEMCEACAAEFKSLNMTVRLLHEVPAVPVPRSFAVRKTQVEKARAPAGLGWGWLKPVTAGACVLLLFFIAGDFSGILPGEGEREIGILSAPDKTLPDERALDSRSMEGATLSSNGEEAPVHASPGAVDDPGAYGVTGAAEGWPLREIQIGLGALIFALVCTMILVRRRQIRA